MWQGSNVKWNGMLGGVLGLVVLVGSSGCVNLTGRWTGDSLKPEMARDQFKLLRPAEQPGKFVSADLRLQQDGTYTAELNYDGKVERYMGTWKYDDKGFLNLNDTHGNSYGYAVRKVDDQTLELIKAIKGSDVTLKLKKQP